MHNAQINKQILMKNLIKWDLKQIRDYDLNSTEFYHTLYYHAFYCDESDYLKWEFTCIFAWWLLSYLAYLTLQLSG